MASTEAQVASWAEAREAIENLIQIIDVEDHDTSHVVLRVRDVVPFVRLARSALRFFRSKET